MFYKAQKVLMNSTQEKIMRELVAFFKELFMITDENSKVKVGLAQFNRETVIRKSSQKPEKLPKEIKLSDLMRKSA